MLFRSAVTYGMSDGKKKHRLTKKERQALLKTLTKEMQRASRALEFERAAELRDMIFELEGTGAAGAKGGA